MRTYNEGQSPDRERRLAEGRAAGYRCFETRADADAMADVLGGRAGGPAEHRFEPIPRSYGGPCGRCGYSRGQHPDRIYDTHVQYTGAWDCWLVEAKLKSWSGWRSLRADGGIR